MDDNNSINQTGPYAKLNSKFVHHIEVEDEIKTSNFLERFAKNELGTAKKTLSTITSKLLSKKVGLTTGSSKSNSNRSTIQINKKKRNIKRLKPLTATEKRDSKVYHIPKECQRYELFLPLHELWKGYMAELTQGQTPNSVAAKLLRADFHGAIITVTRSKSPNLIGKSGIVAQETKNAFHVITSDDRLITLPKIHSIFTVAISDILYNIYGDQVLMRSIERAVKKLKPRPTIDF